MGSKTTQLLELGNFTQTTGEKSKRGGNILGKPSEKEKGGDLETP